MPELPEVEGTRGNLERWSMGRTIVAVERRDARLDRRLDTLVGATLQRWERRGKVLAAFTDFGVLRSHLGMTGRWLHDPEIDRQHQRLVLGLGDGHRVAYVDVRRLGDACLVDSCEAAFAGLGPDAWSTPWTAAALALAMGRGDAPLKARLLDQQRIAGLGNIAVIEACFRARLHPHTALSRLGGDDWSRLVVAIHDHLAATLEGTVGIAELRYVSEGGDNPFLIYGREGEPCPVCGRTIVRAVLSARPTFACPSCQPEVS